jgi:VanZ family protein
LKKIRIFFILALSWFILTIILLILPGSVLPKAVWLDKIWADKWVHIFLFGMLVILWCRYFYKMSFEKKDLKKIFLWLMLSGVLYGVIMEFVQKYFVPNRSFDLGDIIADAIGSLSGFFYSIRQYIKK